MNKVLIKSDDDNTSSSRDIAVNAIPGSFKVALNVFKSV